MKSKSKVVLFLIFAISILFPGCDKAEKNSHSSDTLYLSTNYSYNPGSEYELVWCDEFNSGSTPTKIDESKWQYSLGVGGPQDGNESGEKYWGNDEWQAYTDRIENVFLQDGKLHLKAIQEQFHNTYNEQDVTVDFTSGKIHTHNKFHFRYGKIVAKIKLPNMGGQLLDPTAQETDALLNSGKGVWPAFWMLGANQKANDQFPGAETKTWPECGEIDIIEGGFVNSGNWVVSSTTHWHDPTVEWYSGVVGIWGIPDHMQWPDDEFYWFENDEGGRGRIHGDGYFNNFVDWDNHESLDPSTGKNVRPFYEDFFIFEFVWGIEEDGIKKMYWYIMEEDGSNKRKVFDMAYDPVNGHQEEFAEHFYLAFNLAIGGEGTGFGRQTSSLSDIFLDTVDERDELIVDWVRVYQKPNEKDYWAANMEPQLSITGPSTVAPGETIDLSATTIGTDTSTLINYSWSSSDTEIATVQSISDDGGSVARVSAIKNGTVYISARNTNDDIEASVEITVTDASGDTGDGDGDSDEQLETIYIKSVGEGDVEFSITLAEKKEQVHLFTRKNSVQDYVLINLHTSGELDNGDGSYTYKATRYDSYVQGDTIEARYYTYSQASGQLFYPGPGDASFSTLVYSETGSSGDGDGDTGDGDTGDGDTQSLEKVMISTVGDGDVCFSITVPEKKAQVQLFARTNGIQDYVIVDLHLTGESANSDGSYTYSSTRYDAYAEGDQIEARFYTYSLASGQLFYPGPSDSTFTSAAYASSGETTNSELETVYITPVNNSGAKFSITLPEKKTQVHLFTRKNGVQDYDIIDLHLSGEVDNGDGTYTYESTREDAYSSGDLVEARFYTYTPASGQIFYPGPGTEFSSISYSSTGGSDPNNGGNTSEGVSISGTQLLVDGEPFYIKGVCWNPVGVGGSHPENLDFAGYVSQDAALMKEAGINVIRTYEAITDNAVLDVLYAHGIYVINTVYIWGGDEPSATVAAKVNAVKEHPAILMWSIGNEWNYNGLYVELTFEESMAKLNEAASIIKAQDPSRPVASIYGHIPAKATIDAMPDVDIWGLNMYSGLSFNDVFSQWPTLTDKPMFMAEYGADAWNAQIASEDTASQAEATRVLTQMLIDNSSANNAAKVCTGGTIFEWADEWWKDGNGSTSVQDIGGIAPGGGPYPDLTFNEEYWGIVDIYRNPRPAYYELKTLFK